MWMAGYLAMVQADLPAARTLLEAALSAARCAGDVRAAAYASAFLSHILYFAGEADRGRALAETALRLHREAADPVGVVLALLFDGVIHLRSGELQEATDRFRECVRLGESSGNIWCQTHAQWCLAVAAWLVGDFAGAGALACAGLRVARDMDDRVGTAQCLEALAWIAASQKQAARALALIGAADAVRAAIPVLRPAQISGYHEAALGAAREALPESAATAAVAKGSAMSAAEAIRFALGEASPPAARPPAIPADGSPGQLTRREQDVAVLVARGMSNGQIAATRVISDRTVEKHVQHIMDKLGVSTRAQIAAWSAARPSAPPPPGSGAPAS
jgi:non-specific serine/threonine protein kinase